MNLENLGALEEGPGLFVSAALENSPKLLSQVMRSSFAADKPFDVDSLETFSSKVGNARYCARGKVDLVDNFVEIAILFDQDYFPKIASRFYGKDMSTVDQDSDLPAELLNNLLGMVRGWMERESTLPAARFRPIIPTPYVGDPEKFLAFGGAHKIAWSVSSPDAQSKVHVLVCVEKKA